MAAPLTFPVRVRPGASRSGVGGSYAGPHGPAVVVTTTEPAVDGRATEAALKLVAGALGLKRRDISLRAGESSRDKLFLVEAPPDGLAERLRALREGGA